MEFDPNYISPTAALILLAVELIAVYIAIKKGRD